MKKIVICIASLLCLFTISGCNESSYDVKIGGVTFTCIEHTASGQSILIHDQTNVIYIYYDYTGNYLTPLIKADGTAYTLEDYTKDCSNALNYMGRKNKNFSVINCKLFRI